MTERRMSYRLPENKYKEVLSILEKQGMQFEEFIDKTIDLYLEGKIDPKGDTEGWGKWMEK